MKKQTKKNKAALFWVPLLDCQCVCDKMQPKKREKPITGTSPILKNLLPTNIQARKNTPIMNAAAHIVATHI